MKRKMGLFLLLLVVFATGLSFFSPLPVYADERYGPGTPRTKTVEELRIEVAIEQTFQLYFKEVCFAGKKVFIRIPFGQENERFEGHSFFKGGKGTPQELWPKIEEELNSEEFKKYIEQLSQPGKKLVLLNLPAKSVQVIFDSKTIEKLSFGGNKVYPTELKEEAGFTGIDVYNYLYAKGIGVDCSGFSFNILRSLGSLGFLYGVDFCEVMEIGPLSAGNWIYNHWNFEEVDDKIINLRPGDVIQFHCWNRAFCHSAVIGKIDFEKGEITYVQCTDWVADREERGPHFSKIIFDSSFPERRLSDPRVSWQRKLGETFQGEGCPYEEEIDQYRYNKIRGGGRVIRFKILAALIEAALIEAALIEKKESKFYQD